MTFYVIDSVVLMTSMEAIVIISYFVQVILGSALLEKEEKNC
jgi:hypothetical protein